MRIIPAVLTDNIDQLIFMLKKTEGFTDYAQIDIMDGVFVPSKSVTAKDLVQIKTTIGCEMHLMIDKPEETLNEYLFSWVRQVLIHFEASNKINRVLDNLEKKNIQKGIVLNPDTDPALLEPYIKRLDTVMFMTVYPGYYGRPMVPHVLEKAKDFKLKNPQINVGMDGGIKENNLEIIKSTGADFACVGSAVFLSEDPGENFRKLQKAVF